MSFDPAVTVGGPMAVPVPDSLTCGRYNVLQPM